MPTVVVAAKPKVQDAGVIITPNPRILNFVGAVNVTQIGAETEIDVGAGLSFPILDGGVAFGSFSSFNFVSGFVLTDAGGGQLDIEGTSVLEVQQGGAAVVTQVETLNFENGGFRVSSPAAGEADIINDRAIVTFGPTGSGADYETDGVDDQVQWLEVRQDPRIQDGGKVWIYPGTYVFAAQVGGTNNLQFTAVSGALLDVEGLGDGPGDVEFQFDFNGVGNLNPGRSLKNLTVNHVGGSLTNVTPNAGQEVSMEDVVFTGLSQIQTNDYELFARRLIWDEVIRVGTKLTCIECEIGTLEFQSAVALESAKIIGGQVGEMTDNGGFSAANGNVVFVGTELVLTGAVPGTTDLDEALFTNCYFVNPSNLGIGRGRRTACTPEVSNGDTLGPAGFPGLGPISLDADEARAWRLTLTGGSNITLNNAADGQEYTVDIDHGGGSGTNIAWGGNVIWENGVPASSPNLSGSRTLVKLFKTSNGSVIIGRFFTGVV